MQDALNVSNGHKNRIAYVLFWLVSLSVLIFIDIKQEPLLINILSKTVLVFIYAVMIFVNLEWLIPLFLNKNHFWKYLLLLVAMILLFTPVKMYTQRLFLAEYPQRWQAYKSSWSLLLIMDFVILMCSTIYSIIRDWMIKQRQLMELQQSKMETELNFLRAQVNPHFLFNTLNSIYALALKKSDNTPDVVMNLSEIMRYMLYECNEKFVPLDKELAYIENYLGIERLRHGDNIKIEFYKNGPIELFEIAPLLVNALVENAFKHGASTEKAFVRIEASVNDSGHFTLCVMNTVGKHKEPSSQASQRKSGGFGLKNIRRRLSLIYPQNHSIKVTRRKIEYHVRLDINLKRISQSRQLSIKDE